VKEDEIGADRRLGRPTEHIFISAVEPVASADAAWEALAHDFATNGPWIATAMVAKHRPAIEAAIRGTEAGLDVERLARALDAHMADFLEQPESFDNSALVAANIARHYARLADSEPS
jgi:hypothetical protein